VQFGTYIPLSVFASENRDNLRNNVRAITAYVKLLYDYGQQADLARMYLLHRNRLLDVRENDRHLEYSILRGVTPPPGGTEELLRLNEGHDCVKSNACQSATTQDSDPELEIILDTRIINEIDLSKAALLDISRRLEDKKNALAEIEQKMQDASGVFLSSTEQGSTLELEQDTSCGSNWVECTPGRVSSKH